jgi:hypothetical protein
MPPSIRLFILTVVINLKVREITQGVSYNYRILNADTLEKEVCILPSESSVEFPIFYATIARPECKY